MNLLARVQPKSETENWFLKWHGPTALLTLIVYSGWLSLVIFHENIPVYILFPVAGYLTALHASVQHETIHALHNWPHWLVAIVALPPLGLVFPYWHYRREHIIHHRDVRVTDPIDDPESYYVTPEKWAHIGPLGRALLLANCTLAGRMILGPVMTVVTLIAQEVPKILRVDIKAVKIWFVQAVMIAVLFWFVQEVAGMAFWKYILCFAWPGMMLTLMRSFAEHKSAFLPEKRAAIVESGPIMNLLYLYNNIHIVHHQMPTLPWYRIPAYYRENKERLLTENGGFMISGYGEIVRKYLFKPIMHPVHPEY